MASIRNISRLRPADLFNKINPFTRSGLRSVVKILIAAPSQPRQSSTISQTPRQQDLIVKSPLKDLVLPENQFLAHFFSENWEQFGDKIALVSIHLLL